MSISVPAMQNLAQQLLAFDLASREPVGTYQAAWACERLRIPISNLAGSSGFISLLSRALTLAQRQAPALKRLRVGFHGALEVSDESTQDGATIDISGDGMREGVTLLAELLGLLVTLIGKPLTLRLVRDAWPEEFTLAGTLKGEEQQ